MRYSEDKLREMAKPASDSEELRMDNATRLVKDALLNNGVVYSWQYEVFAQGSYANNTNIRNNSDIDINVCYTNAFYYDLPFGKTKEDYGFSGEVKYSFQQFKNDIESILVSRFGRDQVIRKNKCLHINGNTYRTEVDVVPTWLYRRYSGPNKTDYVVGVELFSDKGEPIINFPKQHLRNGIDHNLATRERYKKLVRIVKRIHLDMEESGYYVNNHITSFLLESMVYLLPKSVYSIPFDLYYWNDILKKAIIIWYNATNLESEEWKKWVEVSELLPLLSGHKWSRSDVNEFCLKMWNFLGYNQ